MSRNRSSSKLDTRTITMSAMLVALGVVFSFFRIPLSSVTEITFTDLPIAAGGYLFGPGVGFLIGALIDICGFLIKPMGTYFPGFTLSSGLIGVIYGLFLYRKWWDGKEGSYPLLRDGTKGLVIRILIAKLLKTILISLLLSCFWLSMYYGMDFRVVFFGSLPKEAINYPIESCLIYITVKLLRRAVPGN